MTTGFARWDDPVPEYRCRQCKKPGGKLRTPTLAEPQLPPPIPYLCSSECADAALIAWHGRDPYDVNPNPARSE